MPMGNKRISTQNNIVIESLRRYVSFLMGLKSILLSFIEEKAPRTGGNTVASISYGVMSGSLLIQIAKEEFINLYEAISSGRVYKAPRKVDFSTYIRCVCSYIPEGSSEHDNKWDEYLQRLMREDMCNRTAVAYSIPYDASTRRIYGNETFIWMLSKLPPKFVSMFLSDTYYKKMGFGDFFKGEGNNQNIEKVIDDSCLRTGFTVFMEKMKQELEMMEKRNQEASLSDLYSFVSAIGESVSHAVDDLKEKNKAEAEQLKDMVNDIGVHLERMQYGEKDNEESLPADAWKDMPFYKACQSIGAVFSVEGENDYLSIDSVDKFANKIIEYINRGEDENVKLTLCSLPSNEELVRRLWSRKKGGYMQLKATSFNQNLTELRRATIVYKQEVYTRTRKKTKQDNASQGNKIGKWKYK